MGSSLSFGGKPWKSVKRLARFVAHGMTRSEARLWPGAVMYDDWYAIQQLDESTFIIGEARHLLHTMCYLICGNEQALLFDCGAGRRDISVPVRSLTSLPVLALPSHAHWDHTAGYSSLSSRALADIPVNRRFCRDGFYRPPWKLFAGLHPAPAYRIDLWIQPGQPFDLGGRCLELIPTPGHTPDSVSLWDQSRHILYSGDFIYPGQLLATMGGSLTDYRGSAGRLLDIMPEQFSIYGAHSPLPLTRQDLIDLNHGLIEIIAGNAEGRSGLFRKIYPINGRLSLATHRRLPPDKR